MTDCRSERIAAESAAMVTGRKHRHDVFARQKCRDRQQAAAEGFAEDQAIRFDMLVVAGQQLAGAAPTGLYFVANKQDVMTRANFAARGQIAIGGHDDAGFALDRFNQESRCARRDRRLEGRRITERYRDKAWCEGAETVTVLRFR